MCTSRPRIIEPRPGHVLEDDMKDWIRSEGCQPGHDRWPANGTPEKPKVIRDNRVAVVPRPGHSFDDVMIEHLRSTGQRIGATWTPAKGSRSDHNK